MGNFETFSRGRGISLFNNKTLAYILQENGYDTAEANQALGFVDDLRNYNDTIQVLKALRGKSITLITNNSKKVNQISLINLVIRSNFLLNDILT